jgi:hypothetical protein
MGQHSATINITKYAKNSIQDSPMLQVNVIRSAIDLATTLSENEAQKLLTNTEKSLERLTQNYGAMPQLDAQLNIIKVRLLSSQKDKKAAEKII